MSLQVWLPLNGDLHNQGLNNTTVTNNGATLNTSGKIGQCYSFNGSNNSLSMNSFFTNGNQNFSFCCWLKINSLPASGKYYNLLCSRTSTVNTGISMWLSSSSTFLIDIGARWITGAQTINAGEWYHICLVSSSSGRWLYINGEQKTYTTSIHSNPTTVNTSKITIGAEMGSAAGTPSGTYLNGCLNDVRIYDHALSAKEVKEIAKGLVLHYKLDQPNANLISLDIFNTDPWKSAINAREMHKEKYAYRVTNSTLYSKTSSGTLPVFPDITFKENTQYTFSIDWIDDYRTDNKSSSLYFRFQYTDGSTATQIISPAYTVTTWTHSKMTSNSGKTVQKITTTYGNGGQLYVANIKLEEGTLDTGYINNSADNIIYDSSGYNHNGKIYSYDTNGSVECVKNSPRYLLATYINSANNTTNTASGTQYIYGNCSLTNPDKMSVAFWCKPEAGYGGATTQGQFCTTTHEYGNTSVGSDYSASAMNHRDGTIDINDSASTTQCRPSIDFIANEWHHYCITYDGQNGKVYRDGLLTTTKSFSAAKTLDSFIGVVIGFSKAGGVWRSNKSSYSDFRIYATALSADDVKELYNTSASIDNNGNVYAREVIEI